MGRGTMVSEWTSVGRLNVCAVVRFVMLVYVGLCLPLQSDCFLERLTKSNAAHGKPAPYTVVCTVIAWMHHTFQEHDMYCDYFVLYPWLSIEQALALDEQLVESIPMDSFDRSLDAIVTPTELLLAPR